MLLWIYTDLPVQLWLFAVGVTVGAWIGFGGKYFSLNYLSKDSKLGIGKRQIVLHGILFATAMLFTLLHYWVIHDLKTSGGSKISIIDILANGDPASAGPRMSQIIFIGIILTGIIFAYGIYFFRRDYILYFGTLSHSIGLFYMLVGMQNALHRMDTIESFEHYLRMNCLSYIVCLIITILYILYCMFIVKGEMEWTHS